MPSRQAGQPRPTASGLKPSSAVNLNLLSFAAKRAAGEAAGKRIFPAWGAGDPLPRRGRRKRREAEGLGVPFGPLVAPVPGVRVAVSVRIIAL